MRAIMERAAGLGGGGALRGQADQLMSLKLLTRRTLTVSLVLISYVQSTGVLHIENSLLLELFNEVDTARGWR